MSLRVPGVDWGVDWGVKAQGRSVLFFLHNVYIGQWQGGSCVLTSLGRSRAIKTFLHDHLQASGDATNAMKTRNRFSLTGSADRYRNRDVIPDRIIYDPDRCTRCERWSGREWRQRTEKTEVFLKISEEFVELSHVCCPAPTTAITTDEEPRNWWIYSSV